MTTPLQRQTWIDTVKGLTITLVVLNHVLFGMTSTVPVPQWIMDLYSLTKPIRMPLFFLVAGFFARKALHADIRNFVDGKIMHFAYYFVVWNTISVVLRYLLASFANHESDLNDIWRLLWKPSFSLWFIYALLLAFLLARLTRNIPSQYQLAASAAIAFLVSFNSRQIPFVYASFLQFYPFFLLGCYASKEIRDFVAFADWGFVLISVVFYCLLATIAHFFLSIFNPFVFYPMALLSSFAIMVVISKLEGSWFTSLLYRVGQKSLYIYLMHFVPAAAIRYIAVALGLKDYPGIVVVCGTIFSILICMLTYKLVLFFPYTNFLLVRPEIFRIVNPTIKKY